MKRFVFIISLIFILFFLGKTLNPFNQQMFTFHDETQAARISQFTLNLKELKIPPRIAPNFSFNLSFPVFNHYAPTPYWITSLINLTGISVIDSLKISFLASIMIGFIFMFLFCRLFFGFYPSILAGLLYASSPWIAVEIFIRGNLAESWFIALLPMSLWFVYKNSQINSRWISFFTIVILGASLTTHNVLSIIFVPFIFLFLLTLPNKKKNIIALILAFLLNAYFFIPAILEMGLTQASNISKNTQYPEHLLCLWQLWTTPTWGYGGSGPGCINDGMSFMLGKPQLLLSLIGFIMLLLQLKKSKKSFLTLSYLIIITFLSIFFVSYLSYPISNLFKPILGFFQFPWRLLSFSLFGIVFLSAAIYLPKHLKKLEYILVIIGLIIVIYNSKFFVKHLMSNNKFNQDLVSPYFISQMASFKIAEYLPTTVDYKTWLNHEPKKATKYVIDQFLNTNQPISSLDDKKTKTIVNRPFYKQAVTESKTILINISYLPYWTITINDKNYIPNNFDKLGRPIVNLSEVANIIIKYQQTTIEKVGNIISLLTLMLLLIYLIKKNKNNG